jgi:acyl-coenzyme A thioesterase PaaI-like protein
LQIKQPNSLFCFVCGIQNPFGLKLKFYQTGPGEVTVFHTIPETYQGYPGIVHGGIVASMLDEAAGRALMAVDADITRFMFTARLDIHYRQPVPIGRELKLVGVAGKRKTRSATATASLYGPEGDLLAEANVILVDAPQEKLEADSLDSLGWKVYPD